MVFFSQFFFFFQKGFRGLNKWVYKGGGFRNWKGAVVGYLKKV